MKRKILKIASYNVHGFRGPNHQESFSMVRSVLGEMDADIAALQEVHSDHSLEKLNELCMDTDYSFLSGPTLERNGGVYGNAVLTRLPVFRFEKIDLTVKKREPRGAVIADLKTESRVIRFAAAHLGLALSERKAQTKVLMNRLFDENSGEAACTVLAGDLNEWFIGGESFRRLRRSFGHIHSPPAFPVRFPFLSLDKILVNPPAMLYSLKAWKSETARHASDHFPLLAEVQIM